MLLISENEVASRDGVKGAIGVIHRQVGFPAMWASLGRLRRPAPTAVLTVEGSSIAVQRNQIVRRADAIGAEWLLFIDDDHVFPDYALTRLLEHQLPLVGGLYLTRLEPHTPTAFACPATREEAPWQPLALGSICQGSPVAVVGMGMGFTLIRREVWRSVAPPWFQVGQLSPDQLGEDMWFCRRAASQGFQAYVDVNLPIGHLAVKVVLPTQTGDVLVRDRSGISWPLDRDSLGSACNRSKTSPRKKTGAPIVRSCR